KLGKIKGPPHEIDAEKRKQHRDAAEKGVEKKLRRGAIAIFTTPDFDEQKGRNQAHFVKEKPEDEILGGERAVKRRLHHEHEHIKTATHSPGEKGEWKNERREQDEEQAQPIDAEKTLRADRGDPDVV